MVYGWLTWLLTLWLQWQTAFSNTHKQHKLTNSQTHTHTRTHTHTNTRTHIQTHTHAPDSSLLCISLPKADIFGLPCTEAIMPQAIVNASLVQVLSKCVWRISFCSLRLSVLEIFRWTPSGIMPLYRNSLTTALASITAMNRSLYSFRTSSAVYVEREDS